MSKVQNLVVDLLEQFVNEKNKRIHKELYGTSSIDVELIQYVVAQLKKTNFWLDVEWENISSIININNDTNIIQLKDEYKPKLIGGYYFDTKIEQPIDIIIGFDNNIYITDTGKGIIKIDKNSYTIENVVVPVLSGANANQKELRIGGYIDKFDNGVNKFYIVVNYQSTTSIAIKFYDENWNFVFGRELTTPNANTLTDVLIIDTNNILVSFYQGASNNYGYIKALRVESFDANGVPNGVGFYPIFEDGSEFLKQNQSGYDTYTFEYFYYPRSMAYVNNELIVNQNAKIHKYIYNLGDGTNGGYPTLENSGIIVVPNNLTGMLRVWNTRGYYEEGDYYYTFVVQGSVLTGIAKIEKATNNLISVLGNFRTMNAYTYAAEGVNSPEIAPELSQTMFINPFAMSSPNAFVKNGNDFVYVDLTNRFAALIPQELFNVGSIEFESKEYSDVFEMTIKDIFYNKGEIYININNNGYLPFTENIKINENTPFRIKRILNPQDLFDNNVKANIKLLIE